MAVPAPVGVSASGVSPYATDQANGVVQDTLTTVGPGAPFAFWGPMNLFIYASYNSALTTTASSLTATVASAGAIAAGEAINSTNAPPGTTVGAISGTTITLAPPTLALAGKSINGRKTITGLASTTGLRNATVKGLGVPASTTVVSIDVAAVAPSQFNPSGTRGQVTLSNAVTVGPQNDQPTFFSFALAAASIATTGADSTAVFTGVDIIYTGSVQLERSFDGGSTWVPCNIGGGGQLAVWATGTPVSASFGDPERQMLYRVNVTALSAGNVNYRISATGQAALTLSVPALA